MKFSATQSSVLKSLMLVLGGTSKSGGDSAMVKITSDAKSGMLTFKAQNLDAKIESFLKCDVEASGETLVEFFKLTEVIKKLASSAETSFELKDSNILLIKSNKSKFSLKAVVPSSAEKPNHAVKSASFKIMSKQMLNLLEKTKFSIYPGEERFNLHGVHFVCTKLNAKSLLAAVSTDGHRLSYCSLEVDAGQTDGEFKVIIPKKSALEWYKILDSTGDDEVEVEVSQKNIILSSPSFTFVSKLIDAEFPEYDKVIPRESSKVIKIARKDFAVLVDRVSAIHTGSSEGGVNLCFSRNLLRLTAKNKDSGEAIDEIQTEFDFDEIFSINYNYSYLLEILAHISSEKVLFCLKDEQTPALIKDENLSSYFFILMPMRA